MPNILIPGSTPNWAATATPAQQGNAAHLGYGFQPIMLWTPTSFQYDKFAGTYRIGVNAFHACGRDAGGIGIEKVVFIANNGTPLEIAAPTFNALSGYWEWWCDVAELAADGIIEVRAIGYPFSGQPFVLQGGFKLALTAFNYLPEPDQSLLLWSNKNGTYNGTTKWVDSVNGNDANTGTEGSPYQTLFYAVGSIAATASHSTINLKAGTYEMHATTYDQYVAQEGWLTIQAAPGVARGNVLIVGRTNSGSGSSSRVWLVRLRNLKTRKLLGDAKIFEGAGLSKLTTLWLDGVWQVGSPGQTIGSGIASGCIDYYNTGNLTHRALIEDARFPTFGKLIQGISVARISGDVLNTCRAARDIIVEDGAPIGADHFDLLQTGGSVPNSMWIDIKAYKFENTNGMLFNDVVKDRLAFVNNAYSCHVGFNTNCLSGGNNIVVLNCTFADFTMQIVTDEAGTIAGKGMDRANGHWTAGNIFSFLVCNPATGGNQASYEAAIDIASPRKVRWENNHYVGGGWNEGDGATTGTPGFQNVDAGLFLPVNLSRVAPRTVPWDIFQNLRLATTRHGAMEYASYVGVTAAPAIAKIAGIYTSFSTAVTGAVGSLLYYTTNGASPTDASTPVTGGVIPITTSCTLMVIAYNEVAVASAVTSAAYQVITDGTPAPPRRIS